MEGIVYVIVKFKNFRDLIKTVTDRVVKERRCQKFKAHKEDFDVLTVFFFYIFSTFFTFII